MAREGSSFAFAVGASTGTYLTLDLRLDVPLVGVGTFTPSATGLSHFFNNRMAPFPPHYQTPAVSAAAAAFRNVPGFTGVSAPEPVLRFITAPTASYASFTAAAFRFAHALRDAAASRR